MGRAQRWHVHFQSEEQDNHIKGTLGVKGCWASHQYKGGMWDQRQPGSYRSSEKGNHESSGKQDQKGNMGQDRPPEETVCHLSVEPQEVGQVLNEYFSPVFC